MAVVSMRLSKLKELAVAVIQKSLRSNNSRLSFPVSKMDNNKSTNGATMDNQLYNRAATAQLYSHDITKPALTSCIARVLNAYPPSSKKGLKAFRIADLGSAGGVNAILLLEYVKSVLHKHGEYRPVEYYFEDLPTSDFNELIKTVHDAKLSEQFYPMYIGRSFYEKLFPPGSIHLFLSYITLHWMNNCPGKVLVKYS